MALPQPAVPRTRSPATPTGQQARLLDVERVHLGGAGEADEENVAALLGRDLGLAHAGMTAHRATSRQVRGASCMRASCAPLPTGVYTLFRKRRGAMTWGTGR